VSEHGGSEKAPARGTPARGNGAQAPAGIAHGALEGTGSQPTPELLRSMEALHSPAPSGRGTTSDLSIDEVLLLHSIGWEPVDLVFGAAWWSIPWGSWQWQTGEISQASSAFQGAFGESADQLREECTRAGGTGVVGVDIHFRVTGQHVDVTLSGTAVREAGKPKSGSSFVSDLSARDFALLCRAGWEPIGLVAGASFVVAPRRSARQWASQQTQNIELPNLTEALYLTRENAMERMQRSGINMHADGIINVKLQEGPLGRGTRAMQFVAVGTAVQLHGTHQRVSPMMVVPLDELVRQFDLKSLRSR
jgi:uncharacterized protein YbjQ (UPF0145 family)